jgi:hypothetical protein
MHRIIHSDITADDPISTMEKSLGGSLTSGMVQWNIGW